MKLCIALLPLTAAWMPLSKPISTRVSTSRQSAVSVAESEDVLRAKAYVIQTSSFVRLILDAQILRKIHD